MVGEIAAVALGANALLGLAREHRADFHHFDRRFLDTVGDGLRDFLSGMDDDIIRIEWVDNVMHRHAAKDTLAERGNYLLIVLYLSAFKSAQRAAVLFSDNHIVGHVDKTTCKVAGVGGLKGGIGKTFTRTVGGDKVFEHRQTLLEVCKNRVLDDLSAFGSCFLRLGHQTTHT